MRILSIVFIIIILLIFGLGIQMFFANKKVPANLGVKQGKLAPMPSSPNAVSSQTEIKDKYVPALPFKGNLTDSKGIIKSILAQYPNATIITESDQYIHVVFETPTMKYRDDLEFYFSTEENKIHFRSASRVGHSDMGLNRKRYDELADKYLNQ